MTDSGSRWFLVIGAGMVTLLLAGCAGKPPDASEGQSSTSEATPGESPRPARRWTGCYALTVEAEGWRVPAILELQADSLIGWEDPGDRFAGARAARSWLTRDASPEEAPFAYWRPVGGDSVEIGHPGALAGMTIRVGPTQGRALAGTIVSFSDVISPDRQGPVRDSASVRADPVACRGR